MQINIAVCDDEKVQRENIKELIYSWSDGLNYHVKVEEFACSEEFLFHYEDNKKYDIILLDIEMGEMSGVELAKKVRKQSENIEIVFITGYSEYILDGYEVSALQYLMKPLNEERFFSTLNRAVGRVKKNEKPLNIYTDKGMARIPLCQIVFIEVIKNYITIHAKEIYTAKVTLNEISKKLDDNFFKVGRSCIVNLNFISKVTRTDVHFANGNVTQLPRGMYDKINRAIIDL